MNRNAPLFYNCDRPTVVCYCLTTKIAVPYVSNNILPWVRLPLVTVIKNNIGYYV
jgi:hypothetical protein